MKSEEEISEKLRAIALEWAKSNDAMFGSPTETLQEMGCITALAWVLDLDEAACNDVMGWAMVVTYRESPGTLQHYFGGPTPKHLLEAASL